MKQEFRLVDGIFNKRFLRITVLVTAILMRSLSVYSQPTASITGNAIVCQGSVSPLITFTGSGGTPPYTFTYNINGGANQEITTEAGNSIVTLAVLTDSPGTFTYNLVSVADAVFGPQPASGSATVTVNPLPEPITGTTSLCAGSSTKLDSTSSDGIWSSSNESVATITPSGVVHAVGSGTSEIRYTFGTGCYSSTIFTVNPLPVPTFTAQPGPTACSDTDVTYSTQSGQVNYVWGYSGTAGTDYSITSGGGAADYTVTLRWLTAGSRTVTVNYTSAFGCTALAAASSTATLVTLSVPASVSIVASPSGAVCSGTSVTFTATPVNGGTTPAYQWQVNGADVGTNSTTYSYSPVNGDVVRCILTSNAACAAGSPATSNIITMTVNPLPAAAGAITGTAAVCQGDNSVSYSVGETANATSYTWSYSGTGVTINGSTNSITIDFSASATSGNLTVRGANSCGSGTVSSNYLITVSSCAKTLTLSSVLLEGLYNGSGTMRQAWNATGPQWPAGVADHITVELRSSASYSTIIYVANDVGLSTSGEATVSIPYAYSDSYFITIRHRNSIETTTAAPVSFAGSSVSQSFGATANVYGNNLKLSADNHYLIYGGDANQDGSVDTGDYTPVVNAVSQYLRGYVTADIDGNGSVDTGDYSILVNNVSKYIRTYHP